MAKSQHFLNKIRQNLTGLMEAKAKEVQVAFEAALDTDPSEVCATNLTLIGNDSIM